MADRIAYGVAETGTWQTASPTPHVDLNGGVPAGLSIRQSFADALTSGDDVTVTVRRDIGNWACYGYQSGTIGSSGPAFTDGIPDTLDFSGAYLLDSEGALANGDAVEVWVELPEPVPGIEEPADDSNPKLRKTTSGVSTWESSGNAAIRNVGTGAANVAQGDAPGAVQANLDTHKTSADHDGRYYTQAQQDATDGAQDTAISDKWGSGSIVDYWILDLGRGGAGTYPVTDGLVLRITNTASGVVNFTHSALSASESLRIAIRFLVVAGDVPQWQVNGTPLDLTGLPTFETGKVHLLTVDITSDGAVIAGSTGLVVT